MWNDILEFIEDVVIGGLDGVLNVSVKKVEHWLKQVRRFGKWIWFHIIGAYRGPKPGSIWYADGVGEAKVHRIGMDGKVEYFFPTPYDDHPFLATHHRAYPFAFKALYKEVKK